MFVSRVPGSYRHLKTGSRELLQTMSTEPDIKDYLYDLEDILPPGANWLAHGLSESINDSPLLKHILAYHAFLNLTQNVFKYMENSSEYVREGIEDTFYHS
jgi:hypothetical protein